MWSNAFAIEVFQEAIYKAEFEIPSHKPSIGSKEYLTSGKSVAIIAQSHTSLQ